MKRVALAGLGTVGGGVWQILWEQRARMASALGEEAGIAAVLVRDINKPRPHDVPQGILCDDPERLFSSGGIDVLIEATGDTELGYRLAKSAMKRGIHVITAGKALVSRHMEELHGLAHKRQLYFLYEASVCGGIPLLKTAAELPLTGEVRALRGIVNGSSNYILSGMTRTGGEYSDLVREAREKGYLEADADDDLLGYDARRKLRILTALALGADLPEDGIPCEGISRVTGRDVEALGQSGYVIKLIASAAKTKEGATASVFPRALPKGSALAGIEGAGNCVEIEKEYLGRAAFSGPGAGALPTAHAIVSDLVDILAGRRPFTGALNARKETMAEEHARFYLRDIPVDEARIEKALGTGLLTKAIPLGEVIVLLKEHPKGAAIAVEEA